VQPFADHVEALFSLGLFWPFLVRKGILSLSFVRQGSSLFPRLLYASQRRFMSELFGEAKHGARGKKPFQACLFAP